MSLQLHQFLAFLQETAPTGTGEDEGPSMLFPLIAMAAIFWFVLVAPDRKARKQRQAMLDTLKKGQEVMTTGGILGKVHEVRDDYVSVQVSDNVRMRFAKAAVQTVMDKGGDGKKDGEAKKESGAKKDGEPRGIKED